MVGLILNILLFLTSKDDVKYGGEITAIVSNKSNIKRNVSMDSDCIFSSESEAKIKLRNMLKQVIVYDERIVSVNYNITCCK